MKRPKSSRTPKHAADEPAVDAGEAPQVDTLTLPEPGVDETPTAAVGSGTKTEPADPAPDDAPPEGQGEGDKWSLFAPEPEAPPSRYRSILAAVGARLARFFGHEWTLASLGSLLLGVVMTWPTMRHPASTIPEDLGDPTLQAWQMAWSGHAVLDDLRNLWNANAFYPDRWSFAFSDTLFGYAPLGLIGSGPTAAILRYNIVFVLVVALAFVGTYTLVRQLGAGKMAATVAGAAFAYAPWRLGQGGHLHVLSTGGIALTFAMLARGHGWSLRDGYRPERAKWGWVLGGWLVAAWQVSLGFGIGLPFAYAMGLLVIVVALAYVRRWLFRGRPKFGWKLLAANAGGAVVFAAVGGLMAYPYLQVIKEHPYARRSEDVLTMFSPPFQGWFIAPKESWLWGPAYAPARDAMGWPAEQAMLPGFFLYALAAAGLFVSVWTVRQRLLLFGGVVVSAALGMGTKGPAHGTFGYLLLYRYLPGFDGIRTPGRLVIWTTLLLAILAAGAVAAFALRAVELRAMRGRAGTGFWIRVATLVPLGLVLLEGSHLTGHPVVPLSPVAMHTLQGPVMVLPSAELDDMNVMLWSTDGFPKLVNGGSGFTPHHLQELRDATVSFPDARSVEALRAIGVRTVVVVRAKVEHTAEERLLFAPIDGLDLTRTESATVVIYQLR